MARLGHFLAVAVLSFSALLLSCAPPPPPPEGDLGHPTAGNPDENGDADGDVDGDADGDANGGGSGSGGGTDPALTIQIDAPLPIAFVRVAVFVNKGNVDRSEAGIPISWDYRVSLDSDPDFRGGFSTQTFPRGTVITLVCDESQGTTTGLNTGVAPIPVPPVGQFVEWLGDTQQDPEAGGGIGDAGTLFFTLNESRTITARFAPMGSVTIRSVGGAQGTGTSLDIDFLAQAPLTIPPQHTGNVRRGRVVGTGITGQQGKIGAWFYFRDGTIVKFTVPAPEPFTSWSGGGMISGRSDTFTFDGRTQTADLDWP